MRRYADPVFERQGGVATRGQMLRAGLSGDEIDHALRRGTLCRVFAGVYRPAGVRLDDRAALLAACLSRPAAVASHGSAAWWWGLVPDPPAVPTLTVPRTSRAASATASAGMIVHRSRDLSPAATTVWRGIPSTRPLRTIVDVGGVVPRDVLDDVIDRALQTRLVMAEAVAAEVDRLRRPGRPGIRAVERSLNRRGLVGAPAPSILGSRTLRLFRDAGIVPEACEVRVVGADGRYRLDLVLMPGVAAEVDGYMFHSRAGDLRHDLHRMNELQMIGWMVLRFTWFDIVHDGPRVVRMVRQALQAAAGRRAA